MGIPHSRQELVGEAVEGTATAKRAKTDASDTHGQSFASV
jgi:hypothetical protein